MLSTHLKGQFTQKWKLSSFTLPQVVSNLSFSLLSNTEDDILINMAEQTVDGSHSLTVFIFFLPMEVNLLCSTE